MLFLAEQAIALRDVEGAVRNVEIREFRAEELERVLAMLFEGVGRDHDEIGVRLQNLRVILLQRSSQAGGSVGVISVTILSGENQIVMPRGEFMQRNPAIGGFDEKLGSL